MNSIYLDFGATTPLAPEVLDTMIHVYKNQYANPSSIHQPGQDARLAIEMVRDDISSFLNAKPLEICFTSGGTEADNLAIRGACFANRDKGKHIITSKIEHQAVLNTFHFLSEREGYSVTYLDVNESGEIDLDQLKSSIQSDTVLVSLMHVNNEIGVLNPIAEIGDICKSQGVLFHTDAVQSFGKLPLDMAEVHVDLLSASAHKIYGPKGVGFTYVRKGTKFEKLIYGGHQEFDLRAGTENVAGIAGLGKALELCKLQMEKDRQTILELHTYFLKRLEMEIDQVHLNGSRENRVYNNINVSFAGCDGEAMLHHLNNKGIAVSSGSACTSGSIEPSHVILALGLEEKYQTSALRFTLGRSTTKEELDDTVDCLKTLVLKLRH